MRKKLLVGVLMLAAFAAAPARADDIIECTDSLPATVCAYVLNTMSEEYNGVFVGGEATGDGFYALMFAGREERPDQQYSGTGACAQGGANDQQDYQCVVLFEYGDDTFLEIYGTRTNCLFDPDAADPVYCAV